MGIQSLQSSGGVEWSKYNIITKELSFMNTSSPYTYSTALSITGKGYLKDITCVPFNNSGGIKITIDDVVVFETFSHPTNLIGIVQQESLTMNGAVMYARANYNTKPIGMPKEYPFISGAIANPQNNSEAAVCILPQPVFFKSNMKIELRSELSNGINLLTINGGVQ